MQNYRFSRCRMERGALELLHCMCSDLHQIAMGIKKQENRRKADYAFMELLLQRRKIMLHTEDPTSADRVRCSTAADMNHEIERRTNSNIRRYANSSPEVVHRRIQELDREWDVERVLEVNAATLALAGLLLGMTVNRKWLVLPGLYCHSCCSMGFRDGARHYPYCGARVYVHGRK